MKLNSSQSRSWPSKGKHWTAAFSSVLAAIGLVVLAVNRPSENMVFIGRFHPLLVHLPIGFIMLLAALELMALWPRFKHANAGAGYVLALAVPAAIASAACGWMLSRGSYYNADLLAIHLWSGVSTAVLCTMTAVFYWLRRNKGYRVGLVATSFAIVVAGHFGASLTHGSEYLFEHAPAPLRSLFTRTPKFRAQAEPHRIADRDVFAGAVQPILSDKCLACHNPHKSKGGLRLDTAEGGEERAVVVPGNAAGSELIQRLHLPLKDKGHMPPAGEPQLSSSEIELLERWIDAGATVDTKVRDLSVATALPQKPFHVATVQTPTESETLSAARKVTIPLR